jgi:hypothetical protein
MLYCQYLFPNSFANIFANLSGENIYTFVVLTPARHGHIKFGLCSKGVMQDYDMLTHFRDQGDSEKIA